mmetsp:Transcript_1477/g.3166  ORF Transcript_1477/g.3166 Transcript_1477/m.3166 type:complete len:104 (+) Transcript_1477:1007-1318(+)
MRSSLCLNLHRMGRRPTTACGARSLNYSDRRAHLPTTPAIIDSDILQLLVFFYDFHPAQASRLEFLVQAEVRSQYKPTGDLKCALGSKLHEHVYFDSGWDAGC